MKCLALLIATASSLVCSSTVSAQSTPPGEQIRPAEAHHERQSESEVHKPRLEKSPNQASRSVRVSSSQESICLMMESAAAANGLPLGFFVRVIWKESSFRPGAVGPVTRSGERAQGIAQFMPKTAAERGLLDPFDPVQALPKAAQFLRRLRAQFGNLGLAAAAYNAGSKRVQDWLGGRGALPDETQRYVQAITGHSAQDWAAAGRESTNGAVNRVSEPSCTQLVALLRTSKTPFMVALERRVHEAVILPWGVQLAAGFSRSKVLASYSEIQQRYRSALSGRDPTILRVRLLSRGTRDFFQVRVGAHSREEADKLCANLRGVGGACVVLRNLPAQGRTG